MPNANRRNFLKNAGQGALVAGLLAGLPALHAETGLDPKKLRKTLIVCLLKARKGEKGFETISDELEKEQTAHMIDLWHRGIFWAGGPTVQGISIEIYAVDTVEEAKNYQRNAPLYKAGFLHDEEYLEWTVNHWPPLRPNVDPYSGKRLDK